MGIFVSQITKKFSIKEVSEIIKKPYPMVHRSIKDLISRGVIIKDSHNLLSLNYKENHSDLAYVESLRKDDFLKKNKTILLFVKDVLNKMKLDYFSFLLFGSGVENKKKARDIDVLIILENRNDIENVERILYNISSNFTVGIDYNVVSTESVYEMLKKVDEANVMNETLDKHILFFGAENYYRLLKNAR